MKGFDMSNLLESVWELTKIVAKAVLPPVETGVELTKIVIKPVVAVTGNCLTVIKKVLIG